MSGIHDLVVVGGGISGLTVAFQRSRAGADVVLLEAADRLGGSITTLREDGWLFELGPNTVLENNPHVAPLLEAAGLAGEKLVASRIGKRRYLWKRGRLHPLPGGPGGFLSTRLFSTAAKLRILREPLVRPAPVDPDADESVASFVRRRLGPEMLDYAVGPFVSGVYAGDPERLAVRWAVAKIHALEVEHGSLIKGALAKRKGPAPGGAMISLAGGLAGLPRALAAGAGRVRTSCPARRVERTAAGWRVHTPDGAVEGRRLVLAVPADVLARLLEPPTEGASRAFAAIPYAPVCVVALGYRREQVAHPLDGFGFLAPRCESLRILGCLFPSSFFPGRAPEGHVALAAFAGGRTDPAFLDLDDGEVLALVRRELGQALGARGEPAFAHVRRWPRAIPQYERGHGRYVALARAIEADLPGLHVAGNVLGGVSVADCVRNACALAARLEPVPGNPVSVR